MNSEREGEGEKEEREGDKLVFRISRPNCDYYCVSRGVFIFCLIRRTTVEYNLKVTKWKMFFFCFWRERQQMFLSFQPKNRNFRKLKFEEIFRARGKKCLRLKINGEIRNYLVFINIWTCWKSHFKGSAPMLFPFHFTFPSNLKIELFFVFMFYAMNFFFLFFNSVFRRAWK